MKKTLLTTLAAAMALAVIPAVAGTTTAKAGATKIHGDNGKGDDYQCSSFEGDYGRDGYDEAATGKTKEKLLTYAILASSAYVDRNDADASFNGGQGRVDNWRLVDGAKEVSQADVLSYLGGKDAIAKAGLSVKPETLPIADDKTRYKEAVTAVTISGKDENGLSIRMFKDQDGTLVLSFRGTADGKDIRDDIKQVSHLAPTPQQYKDAAKVLEAVLANYDGPVVCTGHSLGGGLVQYAMAENNIMDGNGNPRVSGYVYNSAGLNGLETVNSFDTDKARNAAANIIGVRNDADPVSYVGYHLLQDQKMYEVKTDLAFSKEHSIKELIRNMSASMPESNLTNKIVDNADRADAVSQKTKRENKAKEAEAKAAAKTAKNQGGPTGGAAPVQQSSTLQSSSQQSSNQPNASQQGNHTGSVPLPYSLENFLDTQISTNPDVQDAFDTTFDTVRTGLDAVLPANAAQTIADKLEELAKKGVIAAGGAVDKAIQAQIDKLKAEILEQMPGDASKEQMGKLIDDMIAGIGTGDFSAFGSDAADLGSALAGDYASKLVDGLDIPGTEKAALKKTISDAVQAYINGTGVGTSIQGNIEAYVYGKIQAQFGKDVADAWKNAYNAWQGGTIPWSDIGAAAKQTIESWAFQKLEKVIDASLKKLLDNHPVLAEMFKALGIDTGSIMGTIKNIWGVLTGPGDLAAKFKTLAQMAVDGLANMMKSLVHWALDKLQAWLNGFLSKIGKKIGEWVKDKLSNLLKKLHLSQSLIDKAMKAVDAAINAGAKYVASLPSKLEKPIGGIIDKGAKKINEKISGKASTQQQNANPQQQKKP